MMRSIYVLAVVVLMAISGRVLGQGHHHGWECGAVKSFLQQEQVGYKTTVADVQENQYDVKYVKLDIEMSNVTTAIRGSVNTVAEVVSDTMAKYVFEIKQPLVVDSVLINGVSQVFDTTAYVCTVTLHSALLSGTVFEAMVFYGGTPVSGTRFNAKGITTLNSPSWGNWATFTLSEPYSARDWWPCKQSLKDKIDSADIWITVDDSLKAASNGLLTQVTTVAPGRNRYEWKERYPIDYYLISASVAKYVDYSFYMHFDESADTMLVQNYVYDNPLTLPVFKNVIDSTEEQVNFFSSIFGRYPFWKEKYGHALAPLNGGMEHQTMTTLGFFQSWLVAHELGHQWFGDHVTCATWSDIVMNEGFATYCEYLYIDHFRSHAAAIRDIVERQDTVRHQEGGALYVTDTPNVSRLFSSKITYDKGACVLHTLRHVLNSDTYFFDLLRAWQTSKAHSTGTIIEFRDLAKTMYGATVNGIDLNTFFDQWFFKEGYPIYNIRWNQHGDDVFVKVDQTTSNPGSVGLFSVPLELRLQSATSDTIVRVVNDAASQLFHFKWSKSLLAVAPDPNAWLIDSVTASLRDAALGVAEFANNDLLVYPNPTSSDWIVEGMLPESTLLLTNVAGKSIWKGSVSVTGGKTVVPAIELPSGVYFLTITDDAGGRNTIKLLKY